MRDVTNLVTIVHGSHLYGTNTPESDRDFKSVHLPSGKAIILQEAEDVIDLSVKAKDENNKNTAEAIDNQSYSLQKFFKLITVGDMTATEMLFAPPDALSNVHPQWGTIREFGIRLINRDVRGFVGYCRRQAAKYGIRGSRMAAVQGLRELLLEAMGQGYSHAPLSTFGVEVRAYADATMHTCVENIAGGGDPTVKMPHIVCCDRKMPFTAHIGEVFKVYDKVWQNYGERARMAMKNEGIDWKAVSHAVRVAEQAKELLLTGKITFPRPEAEHLKDIKLGKLDYSVVSEELERLVAEVEAITETDLPAKSNHAMMRDVVYTFYNTQVQRSYASHVAAHEPAP